MSHGSGPSTRSSTSRENAYSPALARSLRGRAGFSSNPTSRPSSSTSRMPHADGRGVRNAVRVASAVLPVWAATRSARS